MILFLGKGGGGVFGSARGWVSLFICVGLLSCSVTLEKKGALFLGRPF